MRPLWRQKFDPGQRNVYRGWFPLPPEETLPGWRAAVAAYYRGMDRVSQALMRSVARGLGLPEREGLDAAFEVNPQAWVMHAGERRYLTGAPHVDSGFMTLLAQDGIGGLQARHSSGAWLDVPPRDGTLAVNFGKVLECWCGGRIKATEHRVVGCDRERRSIPFFHEARAEAEIAPLPLAGAAQFVEFRGMEHLRKPLRTAGAASAQAKS